MAVKVKMKDAKKLQRQIEKMGPLGERAVKRTVSEFAKRGPGWVSAGIREHYTVKVAAIKRAGPTKKKGEARGTSGGRTVAGVSLTYKGRPLTLDNFDMKPKKMSKARKRKKVMIPGAAFENQPKIAFVRMPTKKTLTAEVVIGKKLQFGDRAFVAPIKGKQLAVQREEGAARKPLKIIRNVSVPQMITGKEAKETIERRISEGVQGRFDHYMEREFGG